MSQSLAEHWATRLQSYHKSDMDSMRLAKFRIIDIGRIMQVLDKGRALVKLCDFVGTELECEVISIGAFNNIFMNPIAGQACLVLFPTSNIDIHSTKVQVAAQPYDIRYAKCLPIGLQGGNKVVLGSNDDSIDVQGATYNASFKTESIEILSPSINASIDVANNKVELATRQGSTFITVNDKGVTITTGTTYDSQGEATGKCKLVINKQGKFELEGDLQIKGDIKITGNITVSNDVEITGNLKAGNGNFEALA